MFNKLNIKNDENKREKMINILKINNKMKSILILEYKYCNNIIK